MRLGISRRLPAGRRRFPAAASLLVVMLALGLVLVPGCTRTDSATSTAASTPSPETTKAPSATTTQGATTTSARPTSTTSARPTTTVEAPTTTNTTEPGRAMVETPDGPVILSARQMAGQRLIYSYYGLEPPEELLELIRRGECAGVIFFGSNISTPAQIQTVTAKLQEANDDPGNPIRAPLLLMTDQEGGSVRRLPGEPRLSEKQIGAAADPEAEAAKAGAGAAANLSGAGMNVNLAPTLEVYRQPGDFSDRYGRSYSSDPQVVAKLGATFIRAQQAGGVAATAKHFPGLGAASTTENTDATRVSIDLPAEILRTIDEAPYRAAMEAGVRLVMLSWAVYPALDAAMPAGLSAKIVQGELRDRLGFEGVTITDSLGATAVLDFGSTRHRARLAVEAGMDLLLCSSQQVTQGKQAFGGVYDRYVDGTLPAGEFRAAVQRIVDLRFGLAGN